MTQLPNIITLLRIAGSMGLLFCDVMGVAIWIIYGLCGISDIVDGWLARKLKCVTKKGALLDSLADICFVVCCAWKLLPILISPRDVRALLLPSHTREQGNGIPALHRNPHDILVNHPHRHCGCYRHVFRGPRGSFHTQEIDHSSQICVIYPKCLAV